jgi:hypothetical protein
VPPALALYGIAYFGWDPILPAAHHIGEGIDHRAATFHARLCELLRHLAAFVIPDPPPGCLAKAWWRWR